MIDSFDVLCAIDLGDMLYADGTIEDGQLIVFNGIVAMSMQMTDGTCTHCCFAKIKECPGMCNDNIYTLVE